MSCRLVELALLVPIVCGCGLTLDVSADPDGRGMDAGSTPPLPDDASAERDAGPEADDSGPADAGVPALDATACPSPCGLRPQCGCPVGQMCFFQISRGRFCDVPSGAGSGDGEPCDRATDCDSGTICAHAPGSPGGVCSRLCDDDAECPGATRYCVPQVRTGGLPFDPPVSVCSADCDPLTGAGCAMGMTCDVGRIRGREDQWVAICRDDGGAALQGASCSPGDCARGHICGLYMGRSQCLQLCTSSCPTAGHVCASPMPAIVIGGMTYGVCISS